MEPGRQTYTHTHTHKVKERLFDFVLVLIRNFSGFFYLSIPFSFLVYLSLSYFLSWPCPSLQTKGTFITLQECSTGEGKANL